MPLSSLISFEIGWGLEHYGQAFDLHAPLASFHGPDPANWDDRAHDIFLDVTTATWLVGLAAFLFFYGLLFVHLLRLWSRNREEPEPLWITAFLVAYVVQEVFLFDTDNT